MISRSCLQFQAIFCRYCLSSTFGILSKNRILASRGLSSHSRNVDNITLHHSEEPNQSSDGSCSQFGRLAAEEDAQVPRVHHSLQNRPTDDRKISETLLSESAKELGLLRGLSRNHEHPQYIRDSELLKKYCSNGNVKSALSVFFDTMLTKHRVVPSITDAHRLLRALTVTGESDIAFSIYKKISQIGVKPSQETYSRLFRVYAEDCLAWFRKNEHLLLQSNHRSAPLTRRKNSLVQKALVSEQLLEEFGGPGIRHAQALWEKLSKSKQPLTLVTYNAALLALARGGDITRCFSVLEALSQSDKADDFTLVATLSAIRPALAKRHLAKLLRPSSVESKTSEGLTFVMSVWHRSLYQLGCSASSHSLVHLLNVIKHLDRFTGFSDPVFVPQSTHDGKPRRLPCAVDETAVEALTVSTSGKEDAIAAFPGRWIQLDWTDESLALESPVNFLLPTAHSLAILSPLEGWQPWHRLALFGGLDGFLVTVDKVFKVKPCVQLLTELVSLLPSPTSDLSEQELDKWECAILDASKRYNVVLDMGFFNSLIHRRALVCKASSRLVNEAARLGLLPDQITWGLLARTCRTLSSIKQLIRSYTDACRSAADGAPAIRTSRTIRPSREFFVSLLMVNQFDWDATSYVLQFMMGEDEGGSDFIPPDRRMIASLDVQVALFRELLTKGVVPKDGSAVPACPETGGVPIPAYAATAFRKFIPVYRRWIRTECADTKVRDCV